MSICKAVNSRKARVGTQFDYVVHFKRITKRYKVSIKPCSK